MNREHKWPKMARGVFKRYSGLQNGPKWPKMARGPKWPAAQNGPKWPAGFPRGTHTRRVPPLFAPRGGSLVGGSGLPRGPKPYKFIGFGGIHGPKPYKFIGFGGIHGPRPYKVAAGPLGSAELSGGCVQQIDPTFRRKASIESSCQSLVLCL